MESKKIPVTLSWWLEDLRVSLTRMVNLDDEHCSFYFPAEELRKLSDLYDRVEIIKQPPTPK